MGVHRNATATTAAAWVAASLIVVLNVSLLWLTLFG
jgi:manganese transport protein